MAIPVWPASLPQIPLLEGLTVEELAPDVQRTEFDDGPARIRRRGFFDRAIVGHRYRMSAAEFTTFQAFFRDDLATGARRFTMPIFKPHPTTPLRNRTVQLAAKPAVEMRGTYVFVSLSLTVWGYLAWS